ncbi:glycosyltransferase family 4 protein [Rhodocyclus gracilis]|uniref:glycosyltransferase family 4 protein n=1 Tax=Rhodocyclus gracilis TaxID=2929842 RepID=UPI0030F3A03B
MLRDYLNRMNSIAIVSSQAASLVNFRGPLLRALSDKGLEVLALAPDYDIEMRSSVEALGAKPVDYGLSRTGINPLRDFFDCFRLFFLLRRLRPDVVLTYFIKPVIFGTLAAWLARIPRRFAMIEGLGFVYTDSGDKISLKRAILRVAVSVLYRFALARVSGVFFLNNDDANEFVRKRLVWPEKARCLGGIGVDLLEWAAAPVVKCPVTFLLVARLLREKGVIEYIEAARRVKSMYPKTRFLLLGSSDTNPGSLPLADVEAWVAEGVVEWPGHVAVRPWMEQASVFVLPSYREGVPRSTQEAMAMARPVITTNVPGCRETVVDGENGFLVPVRDVGALAEKMLFFVERPEFIGRMGVKSRLMAEARFDVHEVNKRLMIFMGIQ